MTTQAEREGTPRTPPQVQSSSATRVRSCEIAAGQHACFQAIPGVTLPTPRHGSPRPSSGRNGLSARGIQKGPR
eukprot:10050313-Alexandrium_andersonii.AAC.1